MPLAQLMEIVTKKRQRGGSRKAWANKYGLEFDNTPDSTELKNVMDGIILAEQPLHTPEVEFIGAIASRYRAKVVVPNPDVQPIDPTDIVPYTFNGFGTRSSLGSDQTMTKEHILQVDRDSDFGRLGWLEFRGALFEFDVRQSLGGMDAEDNAIMAARIDAFNDKLETLRAQYAFRWVRFSQPQISIVKTVVDNKVRTTRTYGAPVIIGINQFLYRGIRTDNDNHKYFDVN